MFRSFLPGVATTVQTIGVLPTVEPRSATLSAPSHRPTSLPPRISRPVGWAASGPISISEFTRKDNLQSDAAGLAAGPSLSGFYSSDAPRAGGEGQPDAGVRQTEKRAGGWANSRWSVFRYLRVYEKSRTPPGIKALPSEAEGTRTPNHRIDRWELEIAVFGVFPERGVARCDAGDHCLQFFSAHSPRPSC